MYYLVYCENNLCFITLGNGRIGICVSGQTISELHRRVKEKFYPMGQKIILMIGTNDFLKVSSLPYQ